MYALGLGNTRLVRRLVNAPMLLITPTHPCLDFPSTPMHTPSCLSHSSNRTSWATLEFLYNPTLLQNFTYLEPDSIVSSLFVQSVIFGHSLCGLLNKLEGVGKCVGVVVRSCGCGEVCVR